MTGSGDLPRIHPREQQVRMAALDMDNAIEKVTKELTEAESFNVVTSTFSRYLCNLGCLMLRMERHGNTDKPGGFK